MSDIVLQKKTHSETKLEILRNQLGTAEEVTRLPLLTICTAGSYGRLEASRYSDIDLFFLYDGALEDLAEPRISTLRLFTKMVTITDGLGFPKLSNDGEFLNIIKKSDVLEKLGGREDDYRNLFTARMLMLLEGRLLRTRKYTLGF